MSSKSIIYKLVEHHRTIAIIGILFASAALFAFGDYSTAASVLSLLL